MTATFSTNNNTHNNQCVFSNFNQLSNESHAYEQIDSKQLSVHDYMSLNHINVSDIKNDSIIANMLQYDEYKEIYTRNIENFLNLEQKARKSFLAKLKNKKQIHYNLDQTIEQTLDETNYELNLDYLIKCLAFEHLMRDCDQDCDEHVSELLNHAFDLASMSNIAVLKPDFDHYCESNEKNGLVKNLRNIFGSLFSLNYEKMVNEFEKLPSKLKWNVLKNLLYFGFKYFLLKSTMQYLSEDDQSLLYYLASIFNYIQSFRFYS